MSLTLVEWQAVCSLQSAFHTRKSRTSGLPSGLMKLHHPLQAASLSHSSEPPDSRTNRRRWKPKLLTIKVFRIAKQAAQRSGQKILE